MRLFRLRTRTNTSRKLHNREPYRFHHSNPGKYSHLSAREFLGIIIRKAIPHHKVVALMALNRSGLKRRRRNMWERILVSRYGFLRTAFGVREKTLSDLIAVQPMTAQMPWSTHIPYTITRSSDD